jgi:hypothetical protein
MAVELDNQKLLSVGAAMDTVLSQCKPLGSEDVPLVAALGRYLAGPVIAPFDLPPFTNSAMDGFALRSADTPGRLQVIGESSGHDLHRRGAARGRRRGRDGRAHEPGTARAHGPGTGRAHEPANRGRRGRRDRGR